MKTSTAVSLMTLALLAAIGSVTWADSAGRAQPEPLTGVLAFRLRTPGLPLSTAEIWMMNANGTNATRVTCNDREDQAPAFSPNGQMMVFNSQVNVGGLPSQFTYLINVKEGCGPGILLTEGRFARWSPDGQKIVFDRGHLGFREIFVRNLTDGTEVQLTNDPVFPRNFRADWSPDGKKIVFVRSPEPVEDIEDIYVMNPDGSGVTPLTIDRLGNNAPKWSPDGKRIVFQSNRDGNDEIYVMDADGGYPTRLTFRDATSDANPVWSPDGQKIVFHSGPSNDFQLYIMNADGTALTQVTSLPTSSFFPEWGRGYVRPPE